MNMKFDHLDCTVEEVINYFESTYGKQGTISYTDPHGVLISSDLDIKRQLENLKHSIGFIYYQKNGLYEVFKESIRLNYNR